VNIRRSEIETLRKLLVFSLRIGAFAVFGLSISALALCQQSLEERESTSPSHPQIEPSRVLVGFQWIGTQISYPPPGPGDDLEEIGPTNPYFEKIGPGVTGDTFPMTWADDNEIYASAGDPGWGNPPKNSGLDLEKFSGMPPRYKISRVNFMPGYVGEGGGGPKPSGMISVNGVLYLAFQNLLGKKPPEHGTSQNGADATIVSSRDHGKTWTPEIGEIKEPMFPGAIFGGPAFVNTGKDNAGAPDKYVYAISTDQWDNGSMLRVGRVPSDRIQDRSAWEWISNLKDLDHPLWTGDMQKALSVLNDDRSISLPDMVYIAPIKRYVLLTWRLKKDFSSDDGSELMIYDAPHPWGPFTLVHREVIWESVETNPYCPRLPLKWLQVKKNDELTGWIQFSGSWRRNSPYYRSHVRQFRIKINHR